MSYAGNWNPNPPLARPVEPFPTSQPQPEPTPEPQGDPK